MRAAVNLTCVVAFLPFKVDLVNFLISKRIGPEAGGGTYSDVHSHGRRVEALWVSTATQTPQLRGPGCRCR